MQMIWFFREINKYIFPYRWLALLLIIRQIFESGFDSTMRMSLKFIVDGAIIPKNYHLLVVTLLALGVGAIIYTFLGLLGDFWGAKFGILISNNIRYSLYEHIQKLSIEFLTRRSAGDIINCFIVDVEKVENGLRLGLSVFILDISNIIFSMIFLFSLNWQLAVISCIGLTFCTVIPIKISEPATKSGYQLREKEGQIASRVEENLLSQSVIKIFSLQEKKLNELSNHLNSLKQVYVRAKFISYLVQRVPTLTFVLVQLVILSVSAVMAYWNWISVGTLVSYQVLLVGLNLNITGFSWTLPYIIEGTSAMQRLNVLMAEVPQVQEAPDAIELAPFTREICFDNVSFSYSKDKGGIKNLSLNIGKGDFAVFVGPSGAGKSTIVNLLIRFYDPNTGGVLFDGVDLRLATENSLRSQIGLVSQDVILFNCSVRENIRMGCLEATDEQVEAAAKAAEIHDFILTLPQGYDTSVGERGGQLSGGQRQRIALARALVRNPPILILDEATSALDPVTEAGILATLSRIALNHTIIVVTHRLTQALRADVIFVMDSGCIVATGRHTDLIQQGGLYATLWQQHHGKSSDIIEVPCA